jgi:hypothetical protein
MLPWDAATGLTCILQAGMLTPMLRAYLDTSVYGAIDSGEIPEEDVTTFRQAIARGELVAVLSLTVVEELLGSWERHREAAIRRLRLARDLVGFDGMLKPAGELLEDAIRAYAAGGPVPLPTLPRKTRRLVASVLARIAKGRPGLTKDLSAIIADVRRTKESFHRDMMEGMERTRDELGRKTYSREQRRAFTFEAFWTEAAHSWAEEFADQAGAGDACRARGLDGLLDVRPVRLAVGATLSLVFSQVRGECQPDRNDGYDLWHAIHASAADLFVTRDTLLAEHLARVTIERFRVVTSLRDVILAEPAADTR